MCRMQNLDETIPSRREDNPEEVTQPNQAERPQLLQESKQTDGDPNEPMSLGETLQTSGNGPHRPWKRWLLAGAIGFIVIAGLGALGGYQSGIGQRQEQATLQSGIEAVTQFELGLIDLQESRCEIARLRFENVILLNPQYPGASEKLALALLCANSTATSTPLPTATLTPTPDTRAVEEIFSTAQSLLAEKDWDRLLETLDVLRKTDPTYRAVEIDGLYFAALRNRGVARILQKGDLEGGIFDLNRAEQFGPLDVDADGYRQWASWYLTGLSFWQVNWGQAVFYFGQVAQVAPNLHNSSFTESGNQYFYAQYRLATAQVEYAKILIDNATYMYSLKGWCDADALYKEASLYWNEEIQVTAQPTAGHVASLCELNPDQQAVTPVPTEGD